MSYEYIIVKRFLNFRTIRKKHSKKNVNTKSITNVTKPRDIRSVLLYGSPDFLSLRSPYFLKI